MAKTRLAKGAFSRHQKLMRFKSFMEIALKEARLAAERGEVPVGAAVISPQGAVLARAGC